MITGPITRPITEPITRAITATGTGGASLSPVVANKAAWFRKGIGITDVANAVSAWADQSGNGRDLTQATGANKPTKQVDGSILLDGADDFMATSAFALSFPYTVYLRMQAVTWTSADVFIDGIAGNDIGFCQSGVTPQITYLSGGVNGYPSVTLGAWKSVAFGRKPAANTYFIQASGSAESVYVGGSVGSFTGITLGRFGTTAIRYGNFYVKEIIVYSVAHTDAERLECLTYLDSL